MKKTWEKRKQWAHVYMKYLFTAGMRSTQLSESLNAALKRYLQADHNIVQLFTHFNRIVVDKRYKEVKTIYNSRQQLPRMKLKRSPILNQVVNLYTLPIFDLFYNKLDMFLSCQVKECHELEGEVRYMISLYGYDREYIVEALDIMNGIEIPKRYILGRWRLHAKSGEIKGGKVAVDENDPKLEISARYRDVCPRMKIVQSSNTLIVQSFSLCHSQDVGIPYWPQLMNYGHNLCKLDDTNIACSSTYPQSTPLSSQLLVNPQTSQGMSFDEGELNPTGGNHSQPPPQN
ncbi:hypothetical protein ACSBR1_017315 [Camellia fascicularis]